MIFIGIVTVLFGAFMVRNAWVFNVRMGWLDTRAVRPSEFSRMASYHQMMFSIWNWSSNPDKWRVL